MKFVFCETLQLLMTLKIISDVQNLEFSIVLQ